MSTSNASSTCSGAFAELSETHHRILVLRELEGLSYREIGERMELTAPAVESTLFRARRRLEHEYSELDTGRRCASMRVVIARLAEGIESPRERRKLERHAIRCAHCRRQARELGVEPVKRVGLVARAAAFLPLPALLRRRAGSLSGRRPAPPRTAPGLLIGKAGALLATAALAGGGGATLGGYGPLAEDGTDRDAVQPAPAQQQGTAGKQRTRSAKSAPAGAHGPRGRAHARGGSAPRLGLRSRCAAPVQPAASPPRPARRPGAAPPLPPVEQGIPPLQQPPNSSEQLSAPTSESIQQLQLNQVSPEPVGAVEPTAGSAVSQLPPIADIGG